VRLASTLLTCYRPLFEMADPDVKRASEAGNRRVSITYDRHQRRRTNSSLIQCKEKSC